MHTTFILFCDSDELCDSISRETSQKCRREPALFFSISGGRSSFASQPHYDWLARLANLLQILCTFVYTYLVNTSYIQIVAGIVLKIIAILVFGGGAPALLVFGMTSRIVFYRTRYEAYGFTASTYKNVYCISNPVSGSLYLGAPYPVSDGSSLHCNLLVVVQYLCS